MIQLRIKRNYSFSIFKRLTLVYSITIIAIYFVMVTLFLNNILKTSHDLVLSKEIQVKAYVKNLDAQLDIIYKQQINLVDDISVSKLANGVYKDNFEKTEIILYLEKTVGNIKAGNSLIKDVIITFPSQSIIISAIKGYEKKIYSSDYIMSGTSANSINESNGELVMNLGYPLTYSVNKDYVPYFTIQVILSKEVLLSSLDSFKDFKGSDAALIVQVQKLFVLGNQNENIARYWYQNQTFEEPYTNERMRVDAATYQFVSATSSRYPITLLAYINKHFLNQTIWQYLVVLTLLTIGISALFMIVILYTNKLINQPLKKMIKAFEHLQEGKFDVQIYHKPNDEFQYLYLAFNHTVEYIQDLIKNIYEQKGLLQSAELAQLQSQINPHFLYNSFFIINRMAKNESYEQITQFVTLLAKYYRFINKETKDFIPLINEAEHMKSYIDIQQMRFGDNISVQIEPVPESIQMVNVPKLILQPLIENAYNYGLENRLGDGLLKVNYILEKPFINIVIEDNGEEVSDELVNRLMKNLECEDNDEKSHALSNINRRVKLAYGQNCGIHISRSDLKGLKIVIRINEEIIFHG